MPEPTSPSPKSLHGSPGPEDSSSSSSKGKSSGSKASPAVQPASPQPEPVPAVAADVSAEPRTRPGFRSGQVFLSPTDYKLSRHMTRAIAKHIGLDPDSNSRSVRV